MRILYSLMVTALLAVTSVFHLNAQTVSRKVDGAPLRLGFNYGMAWQSSDIKDRLGWGGGMTLEVPIIENDHSVFGVSLRGRYLFAETWGRDLDASTGIANNEALNGGYNTNLNYTSTGFIYQNYYTNIHDLDGELMITLNRLRARTGLLLYGFGGLGVNGYKAKIDQLDISGSMYDYTTIGNSGIFDVKEELNLMRDKDYESAAEGSLSRNWKFAPSLGLGFAVRLGRDVYIGTEYKVTFPRTDQLDGQRWKNDNTLSSKKEYWHYISGTIRVGLGGGGGGGHVSHNYPTEENKPVIQIITPSVTPTQSCNVSITAKIYNITSSSQISVYVGGKSLAGSAWSFEASTNSFTLYDRTITGGQTEVMIEASNSAGKRRAYVTFQCSPTIVTQTPVYPPTITIMEPATSPAILTNCDAGIIRATITNVTFYDIAIRRDGVLLPTSAYTYDVNSKILTLKTSTTVNGHTFVIQATNTAGSASASVMLSCIDAAPTLPPPIVNITSPVQNPYSSPTCSEVVTATVRNITNKNDIRVSVNNVVLASQFYQFDPASGQLSFTVQATPSADILITATNTAGMASDYTLITCATRTTTPVVLPPTVIITNPATSPYIIQNCNVTLIAATQNISDKNNISIRSNNVVVPPASYSFDPSAGIITFTTQNSGTQRYVISVYNSAGSAMDTTTITCKPYVPAPIVKITNPDTEQYTSRTCNETLTAQLVNVPRKSMITVRVNNQPLAQEQFSYNETTGILTMSVNVANRAMVSITANTEGGSAGDFINIFCEPPHAPTVNIVTPSRRPAVSTSCVEMIEARTSYISRKSGIMVSVNGSTLTANQFSFDSTLSKITFQTPIIGSALVSIVVTNETGSAHDEIIITCQAPVTLPGPVVQITKPVGTVYTSTTCNETVQATVLNVSGSNDIQVMVNNRAISGFSFDPTTKQVSFVNNAQGASHVVVIARNAQGIAKDSIDIICSPPKPKPTVSITTPGTDPFTSVSCNERVVAKVTNITSSQGIAVLINGQPLANTQFSYNASTGNVAFNVVIATSSKVVVVAQNEGGIAKDSITLNCQPPAPIVKITNPDADSYVSRSCNELITAKLTNVADKTMITVSVNSQPLSAQQFTYDEATGTLTVNVAIPNRAQLLISATTRGGTASDAIILTCRPVLPPTVTIYTPVTRPAISTTCNENIQARVTNIRNKTGIRVMISGQVLAADQFRFDTTTSIISFSSAIVASTTVNITVTNEAGTASDEIVIACQRPADLPKPVVQITKPIGSPYSSPTCNETVLATVLNVQGQGDIQVLVNNRAVSNFSYDVTSKQVSYNNVAQGTSRVVIVASNAQGIAKDSIDIVCTPPKPRPTVHITTPATSPFASVSCSEHVVASTTNASQVSVTVNGQPLPSTQYNFNAATGNIDFTLSIADVSKVVVIAQNESGIAKDSTTLKCQPPAPGVTITTPAGTPVVSVTCNEKVVAQLVNVPSKSMIIVKANDQALTSDQFTYNETSGVLAVNVNITGTTVVTITATTKGGTASDAVSFTCTPPQPPTIQIYTPVNRPTVSTSCRESIQARTRNVSRKSQIRITVNDHVYADNDYSFDTTSKEIRFVTDITGNTTVTIVVTTDAGTATDQVIIACQPAPRPVVQITDPTGNPWTSVSCQDDVIATVLNVNSQNDIQVLVNNRAVTGFQYDLSNKKLKYHHVTTAAGRSHIVIVATNPQGTGKDSIDIVCAPPPPAPTVSITTPATDPFVSVDCNERVTARVTNVTSVDQIAVLVNGQPLPQAQYTLNASTLSFSLTLSDVAKVMIIAENGGGIAKDSVTLKCQPAVPTVNVTSPATTPYTSVSCNERVTVQLRNVESVDQITVRKDGVLLTGSQYIYTTSTGVLQLQASFTGRSTISVRATTRGGTAADSVTLVCAPPRPTVNITYPSTDPFSSSDCSETVTARVTQVDRKEQITLRQDGVVIPAANWTYNASTSTISYNANIRERMLVQIEATTLGGTAKDSVVLTCDPPKPRPVVNITSPAEDPYTTTTCKENISATLQHVTNAAQISVFHNGTIVNTALWTFSPETGTLILSATPSGSSKYIIKAQTDGGSDADTITLICQAPKPRPVVHITSPASEIYNSTTCQERVTARVNNVRSKSEISITLNGQLLAADQFTFNGTDLVETNVSIPSSVQFMISVSNDGGQDSDTIQLKCVPPAPVVTITSPSGSPYLSSTCREQVTATVTNVENKSFISVYLNNTLLSRELFEYNPSTRQVTLTVAVEQDTRIKIVATNQGGTASAELAMQCRLQTTVPVVTISDDCEVNNASRRFSCTEGCTYTHTGSFNTPLTVAAGEMICITGTYAGPLVMNGGTLSVCGAINPTSISFNSGTIIVTGSATFNHLVMNDPNSQILVYGSLAVFDGFVRGKIENFGSFSFQGQLAVNAGGILKNYGELTLNQDVANSSIICNKGTLRITTNYNSNGSGKLYNYCKVYIGGDLNNNNGHFENFGAVKVSGNSNFNTGTVIFRGGSKLITQNLQVNCAIAGDNNKCAGVFVEGTTTLNSSANITGKIDICDKNDIEVNNAKGNFTTDCSCSPAVSNGCDIAINQDDYTKVTICHKPPGNTENWQTLRVPRSALKAHLDHGDSLGECAPNTFENNGNGNGNNNREGTPQEDKSDKGVFESPNNNNPGGWQEGVPPKPTMPATPKINLPEGVQPK